MDRLLPITTFEIENADFTQADIEAEAIRYLQRQRAISACLAGREHPDVVLDMLEAHSIDPIAYVDEVEEGIDFIITHGLDVDP
jgi:hypothetical protein